MEFMSWYTIVLVKIRADKVDYLNGIYELIYNSTGA